MNDTLLDRAYELAKQIHEDCKDGSYVDFGGRIAKFAADEVRRSWGLRPEDPPQILHTPK